jgi:predicted nucleotidyltransferase
MNSRPIRSLDEFRSILRSAKPQLAEQFGVRSIGIFGSWIRGEQRKDSDLDVLVDFDRPIGLFRFIRLNQQLNELLGTHVDLVAQDCLDGAVGTRIRSEVASI